MLSYVIGRQRTPLSSMMSSDSCLVRLSNSAVNKPDARTEGISAGPSPWPRVAAMVFGIGILLVPIGARELMSAAETSTSGSWLAPPTAETTSEAKDPFEMDDEAVATTVR